MQLVVAFSALITGVLFSHFNTIINMDLVKEANKQEENRTQLISCVLFFLPYNKRDYKASQLSDRSNN
ncbi:hypothetical protein B6U47_08535 [Ligilactobacillus salivarius]|nr:hypothetical protein B6U47_08535 [Ligilactobacillus salivarius]